MPIINVFFVYLGHYMMIYKLFNQHDFKSKFLVHVCWSEHSDSSFVYGFMSMDYGLGTMTTTTFNSFDVI